MDLIIKTELKCFQRNQLTEIENDLIQEAIKQLDYAYAPYSNFLVGAAVLLNNGKIYGGCNQENASYPLCMCGERVAIYHATISAPGEKIVSVAITARNEKMKIIKPVMPCGACRQVITEYSQRHDQLIKIYLRTDDDMIYICEDSHLLLPFGFDKSFLK
jgi:cytidine deaminase